MKIIKGNYFKDWKEQVECKHCHSILEIEESDIKYNYYSSDYYDSESISVKCQICKSDIYVKEKIPFVVLTRLRGKK